MTDVNVGDRMPVFELPDHTGKIWNLDEQLSESPVVLVFYRGDW